MNDMKVEQTNDAFKKHKYNLVNWFGHVKIRILINLESVQTDRHDANSLDLKMQFAK